MLLSDALPVVPAKLVRRYIDMAELLKDNIEVERRRMQAGGGGMQHFQGRPSRREIPDIISWVQCFGLYAAVVTSRHPEKTRELLAYQTMIVSEARRLGGRGWLLYDTQFRQQITSFDAVDFSGINQSLYATTFLAYGGGGRQKVCPDLTTPMKSVPCNPIGWHKSCRCGRAAKRAGDQEEAGESWTMLCME